MIAFLIILCAFLTLLCGALGYACFNLLRKIDSYESWVSHFRSEIENLTKRLKMVDEKNLFERDDDVGFVFSEIQRVTNEFNEIIK